MITVAIVPVLKDNYAYVLQGGGQVAVVDPGEAAPVIAFLEERNLKPDYIFNTHHHGDHIAGNVELVSRYDAKLCGPASEQARIPGMDIMLDEHSDFSFGGERVQILETPGHTLSHICFYFPQSGLLFSGDTLFLMGCGRLFEGTPEQMWESLGKIMALPDETLIYCGHEYTAGGADFGLQIDPQNEDLQRRAREVKTFRENNRPTVPATLALEKKTNVFLRAGSAQEFARLRTLKDGY